MTIHGRYLPEVNQLGLKLSSKGGSLLPTDYVKAVYTFSTATLVMKRADGDGFTLMGVTLAEAQQHLTNEGLDYLLPIEEKSDTAWGLLKSAGNFKI